MAQFQAFPSPGGTLNSSTSSERHSREGTPKCGFPYAISNSLLPCSSLRQGGGYPCSPSYCLPKDNAPKLQPALHQPSIGPERIYYGSPLYAWPGPPVARQVPAQAMPHFPQSPPPCPNLPAQYQIETPGRSHIATQTNSNDRHSNSPQEAAAAAGHCHPHKISRGVMTHQVDPAQHANVNEFTPRFYYTNVGSPPPADQVQAGSELHSHYAEPQWRPSTRNESNASALSTATAQSAATALSRPCDKVPCRVTLPPIAEDPNTILVRRRNAKP
eukprot:GHVT01052648.1.p1 GENE.GHVT01052648.1~~GHVT01052648.1.p1  ORF type:complete len:273 (-),score=21.92 GHVT01052648.1:260-1078(-)